MMTEDGLLLASAPNIVKDLVQRRKRGDATLASNPDFEKARKSMVKGGSVFQYADLRPFVATAYNMASMALPGLASQLGDVPIDFALLPTTETFTRHLSPSLVSYVADRDGLLFETQGPLTLGALVPLAASALSAFDRVRVGPEMFRHVVSVRREAVAAPAPAPAAPAARSANGSDPRHDAAVAASPTDGAAAFQRAMALHNSRRYVEAREGFEQAMALGQDAGICEYNIGCGYSLLNEPDLAFEHIERALELGFSRTDLFTTDTDLDNIRGDERFKKLGRARVQ
jgi:hypothetical protein